eukprot:TRINITY_DN16166_c0_g1_i1.p1 TRINITY_DN16166_c0_g1~~TRINITY_DN16166_c0_g1_i1.p1  ORF type:complete len:192 (-),score=38.37 TRINITY_DN16166_c0_g1_i1:35-610(-)
MQFVSMENEPAQVDSLQCIKRALLTYIDNDPDWHALGTLFQRLKEDKIIAKDASKKQMNQALRALVEGGDVLRRNGPEFQTVRLERTSWDELLDLVAHNNNTLTVDEQSRNVQLEDGLRYVCTLILRLDAVGAPPETVASKPCRSAAEARVVAAHKTLEVMKTWRALSKDCLLYTSPSPRDRTRSRMPSSA